MENNKNKTVHKEFFLSSWAVNNRKTVYLVIGLIIMAGLGSYFGMPKENFPELSIPEIYVGTPYPGNSPKVIEDKITRPFEKEINTIKGVKKMESSSIYGYSSIKVEFEFDIEPSEALRKVKDAVDIARGNKDFPSDLPVEPQIFEMDISEMPIMNINLSGNYSVDKLKEYGELIEDELESISEINSIDIRGVQEKELKIEVDRAKMEARKVSFYDIEQAVKQENVTMSGGEILDNGTRRTIRIDGEFKNASDLEQIIVRKNKSDVVFLRDIATISFGDAEPTSYAREFGKAVVMLDVKKRSGANLLDASDHIATKLKEIYALNLIPGDVTYTITNDQSDKTRAQVSNLENSIILGILLVVLVLMFFLGLRNAIFVGLAIPLSMLMSFIILSSMGVSLNVMVLFSLVIALGMLVDNGIVVVENVYRLMSEGYSGIQAAKYGIGEVALPIIASTATTLAAFIPLAFWPGMMGEFMKYLPITLIIVLGSSLFVALVINSTLTAIYMNIVDEDSSGKINKKKNSIIGLIVIAVGFVFTMLGTDTKMIGNLFMISGTMVNLYAVVLHKQILKFQSTVLPKLSEFYKKILVWALKGNNPYFIFSSMFGLLFFSFVLLGVFTPKIEFFPINDPSYVNILIEKPIGTDIKVTDALTKEIEKRVEETLSKYDDVYGVDLKTGDTIPYIKSIIAQVGEGTSDPSAGPSFGETPNKARITVSFAEFEYRNDSSTSKTMKELRNALVGVFPADVSIVVDKDAVGPPQDPPINIEVQGFEEYDSIIDVAENLRSFILAQRIDGIENLQLDIDLGKPELPVEIDIEKARRFNLSTQQIAYNIRTALFGSEFSTYKKGKDSYDLTLKFNQVDRENLDNLLDQKITFRDQMSGKIRQIPIRSVIKTPKNTSTYSAVMRKNQKRMVTVQSKVTEGFNENEVVAEIKDALLSFKIKDGYQYDFTGKQQEQAKEMAFLSKALGIAVFLIFLILVSQFNSFSSPVIIMISVMFSLIGVLLGLVVFQRPFVIMMTMIGIISLAGVVVNNAIVLIDYTNLIIDRKKLELGYSEDEMLPVSEAINCIVEGGKTRLQPVLLTAITTILGLLPMAIQLNFNFMTLLNYNDGQFFFGGDNAMFFGPMSEAIIFGLTFSTFLTLLVIPSMYLITYKLNYKFKQKKINKIKKSLD